MTRVATVHVVMVNLNRWRDTVECLESLLRASYPALRVVVTDNGSSDDSVPQLKRWASGDEIPQRPASAALSALSWPPVPKPVNLAVVDRARAERGDGALATVTLIANPQNAGFAVANNIALRMVLASGAEGYALLINNDMVVAPDCIATLVDAIESDAGVAAMGGVVLDYANPERVQMVGGARTTGLGMVRVLGAGSRRDEVRPGARLGFVGGGLLLTRLRTLREVGLLDETFFLYGEDYDWGERMRRSGHRLAYTTEATVWHKGSVTVERGSPFQDYHLVRGTLRFVRKHRRPLMPLAFGYSVVRSLAPKIVRREWDRARAVLRAYRDHLAD